VCRQRANRRREGGGKKERGRKIFQPEKLSGGVRDLDHLGCRMPIPLLSEGKEEKKDCPPFKEVSGSALRECRADGIPWTQPAAAQVHPSGSGRGRSETIEGRKYR